MKMFFIAVVELLSLMSVLTAIVFVGFFVL